MQRVSATAEDDDNDSMTDEGDAQDGGIDLRNVFFQGQYLRAYVLSTVDESSAPNTAGKPRRRIELSIRPEHANHPLTTEDDIAVNSTVMASIVTVEDHGLVMDLGLSGLDLRGFLRRRDIDEAWTPEMLQPGAVMLCLVTKVLAGSKVVHLATTRSTLHNTKNRPTEAISINTFLPGTTVDVLVTDISSGGLVGTVTGHLDVTADLIHSGIGSEGADLKSKYKIGSKVPARVICTFPEASKPKVGISLLPHILSLDKKQSKDKEDPTVALPNSSFVEKCTVTAVDADIGLFVDVGLDNVRGFVHISRVKDEQVDTLFESSGPFQAGSVHRGRVLGYSALDGLFSLSFEKRILEQPFLTARDVPIGEVVSTRIEKLLIGENGVKGLIVRLADNVTGLVTEMHMSDVQLQHPERHFSVGSKVKARVLSTDPAKNQIRLTLKKSMVNSDAPILKSLEDATVGSQVTGVIVNLLSNGAIVQFYGPVRGFLPISEMSEAYIRDPKEHFRLGQAVAVHIIDCDVASNRLVVSCKDPSVFGLEKQTALKNLKIGDMVSGKVARKTEDHVFLELDGSNLLAQLPVGHLTDKSDSKNQAAVKRIHVGKIMSDLMVLEKNDSKRFIKLTAKKTLIRAKESGKLLVSFDDAKIGDVVPGFVRNITQTAVFIQFGGRLTALLPKGYLPEALRGESDCGLVPQQSLSVRIHAIDREQEKIIAGIPTEKDIEKATEEDAASKAATILGALDESIKTIDDVQIGRTVKARVTAVKDTQINIQIADNLHGRVDISQVYDRFSDIPDPRQPLKRFYKGQVLVVRILGIHDTKNHRFLSISHRSTRSVVECSIKPSDLIGDGMQQLTIDKVEVGSTWPVFVNNVVKDFLWVSLSPTIRGRIESIEASDEIAKATALEKHFPVGSAIEAQVLAVDLEQSRLEMSARRERILNWDALKPNMVLTGRVIRVGDTQVSVRISAAITGSVQVIDVSDDYDLAREELQKLGKNSTIKVSVVSVDKAKQAMRLSLRESRLSGPQHPVKDREITDIRQLKNGEIIRGMVKNVAEKGVFVQLGGDVTAMVKISDISDKFIKDWQAAFKVGQVVKGRIISLNLDTLRVELNLKESVVSDNNWVPPLTWSDLKEGQIVTGTVRKVEAYGVFILIDNSAKLSGLCHRSEMADAQLKDVKALYSEGDKVKAKILKLQEDERKITLGLKPSYVGEDDDNDVPSADEMDLDDNDTAPARASQMAEKGSDILEVDSSCDNLSDDGKLVPSGSSNDDIMTLHGPLALPVRPLGKESKVSWQLGAAANGASQRDSVADLWRDLPSRELDDLKTKKNRPARTEKQTDRTELDINGPQTADDFERLLLGEPDDSRLWILYMVWEITNNGSEGVVSARRIAERALKMIDIRLEDEKLNIWTAYLNLEVSYGSQDSVDQIFKRACQYNDELAVHSRLAKIYVDSKKVAVSVLLYTDDVYSWKRGANCYHSGGGRTLCTYGQEVRLKVKPGLGRLCPIPTYITGRGSKAVSRASKARDPVQG